MLENLERETLGKVTAKVPEWKSCTGLEVPGRLSAEQCSSSATASCKARIARELCTDSKRIADLTGGLGVDSWFFSRTFDEVLYFERDKALCEAAARNFARLGATGIRTVNCEFGAGGEGLGTLRDFHPGIIYLDPARRDGLGRKVFLLEDCEPDLTALLPVLLGICGRILVKVSPMADISMLRSRIGDHLREVRIIQSGGEVKELLLTILEEGEGFRTSLENLDTGGVCTFLPEEERQCRYVSAESLPEEGALLFEPGPGLSKAGAFRSICSRYGALSLGPDSHLYIIPQDSAREAGLFGKVWKVIGSVPMCGKSVRETGRKYPEADVTARGLRMSSEELASRLGVRPGRGIHIFGIGCGPATGGIKALVAATRL